MKLSIQVRAFMSLLSKLLIAAAIIFAVTAVAMVVPFDLLIGSVSVLFLLFCIYNLYQIELMRLQREQDTKIDSK